METVTLKTDETPEVTVTALGDLRVMGWDRAELNGLTDVGHDLTAIETAGRIEVHSTGAGTLYLPRRARLTIEECKGDARLKSLDGPAVVRLVHGDLALRKVAAADVAEVKGDLSAKRIAGDLTLGQVYGDVAARDVQGQFRAERVNGDLYLREAAEGAQAAATGDVVLGLTLKPGCEYAFQAGGDILCRLPAGTSATISVTCGSGEVGVDIPGAQMEGEGNSRTVTLGQGEAIVRLEAKGDVSLVGLASAWEAMGDFGEHFGEEFGVMAEEFAQQIESQIEAQMGALEQQLHAQIGNLGVHLGAMSGVDASAIARRARAAAERAGERARRHAERAQRRAEQRAERARRRAESRARRRAHVEARVAFGDRSRPWRVEWDSGQAARAGDPVSDEERLAILRMVEQKKISVQEAEKLLSALEGRG